MILIVTSKRDGHVQPVARHLAAAGAEWVRINIEDFATNVELDVEPATGSGWLRVKDSAKEFRLDEVEAVWYRKPDPVHVLHFEMNPPAREYVEAEFTEVILGLYALLKDAYWINNPFATRIAHRKLLQLKTAVDAGFIVPPTLVTNRRERALDFAAACGGDLAIKSLGAISITDDAAGEVLQYGVFTRRIATADLTLLSDKIAHMPTLYQQFIVKDSEIRITCVGDRVFACRIEARPGDLTSDDYRFDTPNLQHAAIECPELTSGIQAYMRAFGLRFGCFDFIVAKNGDRVFLECNPNGQWYWVEERTAQPIGAAIASDLLDHCAVRQGTVA